jgi:hypothetical protein
VATGSAEDAAADPAKRKLAAGSAPASKIAKPRPRIDPRRPAKSQPKEQTWNDDSPFLPVATPKR